MRFDHLGVIVKDLALGRAHLQTAFGVRSWTVEFEDPILDVRVQFGQDHSGFCYETIAPLSDRSPVSPVLRAGTRILNHVAYIVPDIRAAATHLEGLGFAVVGASRPAVAYRGARVQFFGSPLRFMVELIEASDHRHEFIADGDARK